MRRRKRTKMEDPAVFNQLFHHFFLFQHHIGARIAVKAEITISVRLCMYKCKRRMHIVVKYKVCYVGAAFFYLIRKHFAKMIVSYFSYKCRFPAKLIEHRQYVARRPSRIRLQYRVSLGTYAVFGKINEQLPKCCYVVRLCYSHI